MTWPIVLFLAVVFGVATVFLGFIALMLVLAVIAVIRRVCEAMLA